MILYYLISCIIQGITEFLPVSSSAHLAIVQKIFGIAHKDVTLIAALNFGTLLSAVFYFRSYLLHPIKNIRLAMLITIAAIPALFVGFMLHHYKISLYDSVLLTFVGGIVGAIILWVADASFSAHAENLEKTEKYTWILGTSPRMTATHAIIIGLFQIFAFIPGLSRMGITIAAARFLNMSRLDALFFSIFLSIPLAAAATLSSIKDIFSEMSVLLFIGLSLLEAVVGYFVIHMIFRCIKNHSFLVFVIYRFIFYSLFLFLS